jgi:hypothetical protein
MSCEAGRVVYVVSGCFLIAVAQQSERTYSACDYPCGVIQALLLYVPTVW